MADTPPTPRAQPLMQRWRAAHATLAPFVLAPLLLTACTGMAYRLLKDWGGWDRDRAHALMTLHEGEWLTSLLGPQAETLYVVLNGLGLLWMLSTGALMVVERLRRSWGSRKKGTQGGRDA